MDALRTKNLDEIYVRAFRAEVRVTADFRAELLHHGLVGIRDEQHRVWHAGVQRMDRVRAGGKLDLLAEAQIFRRRQVDRDAFAAEVGGDNAGLGLESEIASSAGLLLHEAREAARAIAAHLAGA